LKVKKRRSAFSRLFLITAAASSLLIGYYWGNQHQRDAMAEHSAIVLDRPINLDTAALPNSLRRQAKNGKWQLMLPGQSNVPGCQDLLTHYAEVVNRLAAYPEIQESVHFVLLDTSGIAPSIHWQNTPWAQVVPVDKTTMLQVTQQLNIEPAGTRWCEDIQATAVLFDTKFQARALIPIDKPVEIADNLRTIIQSLLPTMSNQVPEPTLLDRFTTNLLKILPQHLLSDAMHKLARSEISWVKNTFIRYIVKSYNVDMSQAKNEDPLSYASFNKFFTRELKDDARPFDPAAVISPTDGKVSQAGAIKQDRLLQAKGHEFSLYALLAGNGEVAQQFNNGNFATIYLAPRDYHRIHMPLSGTLREMTFVPGDLFSVSEATTQLVPGLFARNERLICLFDTEKGPMVVIFVGAIFVGSMETVWAGEVKAPGNLPKTWKYEGEDRPSFKTGDEIGRFNMGSTVVVLFPEHAVDLIDELAGQTVQMGQSIAY